MRTMKIAQIISSPTLSTGKSLEAEPLDKGGLGLEEYQAERGQRHTHRTETSRDTNKDHGIGGLKKGTMLQFPRQSHKWGDDPHFPDKETGTSILISSFEII